MCAGVPGSAIFHEVRRSLFFPTGRKTIYWIMANEVGAAHGTEVETNYGVVNDVSCHLNLSHGGLCGSAIPSTSDELKRSKLILCLCQCFFLTTSRNAF